MDGGGSMRGLSGGGGTVGAGEDGRTRGSTAGRCFLPDLFDVTPPQPPRPLNSVSWGRATVSDSPGLASMTLEDSLSPAVSHFLTLKKQIKEKSL